MMAMPLKWLFIASLTSVATISAVAQEFRVETEVYVGNEKQPTSESLTLFTNDIVYDFLLSENEEIAVFDVKHGRIVLLDAKRKSKTEFTTETLLEFSTAIQMKGAGKEYESLFHPRFETTFDEELKKLRLESDRLTYSAKGMVPKQPNAAKRYQQFADWYARLNAIRPGNLPPFGRLELNRALAERNLMPEEIERTVVLSQTVTDKKLVARSHHAVTWIVSFSDRKRMETADRLIGNLEKVAPKEYWNVTTTEKKSR